ncbi:hypothetical protein ACF1AB_37955 [Streptomyces sp. NPDC014846]|uniref:hypothetical protein n=1 Tax=Streptomyces sp. NPDC014846 TaxID=3364922 RepID=UPI003700677F
MNDWTPLVYRGDGAWIGIMPDGRIGVGVESEGRSTLEGSGFVPMWPYLERDLSASLVEFSRSWTQLGQGGVSTPERLLELTVKSAWNSGRSYWMQLAAPWAIEMFRRPNFDQELVRELLSEMGPSVPDEPSTQDKPAPAGDSSVPDQPAPAGNPASENDQSTQDAPAQSDSGAPADDGSGGVIVK